MGALPGVGVLLTARVVAVGMAWKSASSSVGDVSRLSDTEPVTSLTATQKKTSWKGLPHRDRGLGLDRARRWSLAGLRAPCARSCARALRAPCPLTMSAFG